MSKTKKQHDEEEHEGEEVQTQRGAKQEDAKTGVNLPISSDS